MSEKTPGQMDPEAQSQAKILQEEEAFNEQMEQLAGLQKGATPEQILKALQEKYAKLRSDKPSSPYVNQGSVAYGEAGLDE